MPTRREFLTGAIAMGIGAQLEPLWADESRFVNDIHSGLNRTRVSKIVTPKSAVEVQEIVRQAKTKRMAISIAGGRHAMGSQQFGTDTILVDMTGLNGLTAFDTERHLIEVSGGAFWPAIMDEYLRRQSGQAQQWGIAQKQTGADKISIAGTLAANAHGRGLTMKPFVSNIEAFTLINADGELVKCSREENADLFKLAIGGYGLFGIVSSVTLRLIPRQKIQRVVEIRTTEGLMDGFDRRIKSGFLYGDFQFSIDRNSDDFLHKGVFFLLQAGGPGDGNAGARETTFRRELAHSALSSP